MAARIIVETVELQAPFAPVPHYVLMDTQLSMSTRALYGALYVLAWEKEKYGMAGYQGQRKLAKRLGVSAKSVTTWLNELRERGYIETRSSEDAREADDIIIRPLVKVKQAHQAEVDRKSRAAC